MNPQNKTIFVISSPSGGGKNTLIDELLKRRSDIIHCISSTTRNPRKGEKEGVNYYFISREEFEEQIEKKAFLEWAPVLDNYYGTSNKEIERIRKAGKVPILDIDIQGAFQLKEKNPYVCLIFIVPPSLEELERRLRLRGTETEEEIVKRMKLARKEINYAKRFDHLVVNDTVNEACNRLEKIINALIE